MGGHVWCLFCSILTQIILNIQSLFEAWHDGGRGKRSVQKFNVKNLEYPTYKFAKCVLDVIYLIIISGTVMGQENVIWCMLTARTLKVSIMRNKGWSIRKEDGSYCKTTQQMRPQLQYDDWSRMSAIWVIEMNAKTRILSHHSDPKFPPVQVQTDYFESSPDVILLGNYLMWYILLSLNGR